MLKQPCDDAAAALAPDVTPCSKDVGRWVLAATILGSSMAFIDGSVVNVALPVLQAKLNATVADVQWIVEAYALFLAALILVGGSLGDHLGRRRIFAVGVGLFTLASIGCGAAQTATELIIGRAIQGVGGAMLVPGSLAIISASFKEEERGRAIGTWSGFSAITSALGPVMGGWLVQNVSWRAIFFLNVPLAAAVLLIVFYRVPESRNEGATGNLDWWGAVLATGGLGSVVYGLIEASTLGFQDKVVLATLVLGAALLAVFVWREARTPEPMISLHLFKSRTFAGANILTLFLYGALSGVMFFLPFNLIRVHHYSPTAAGASFLPFILIMFLFSRWSGGLVNRFGKKLPLVVGPVITSAGFALMGLPGTGGNYWTTFFPATVVMGVGMTIAVAPLTTVVMTAVSEGYAGAASGINNAASRVAGLIAIAALNLVVLHVFSSNLDAQLAKLRISPSIKHFFQGEKIRLAGARTPTSVSSLTRSHLEHAIDQSFVNGFRFSVLIAVVLGLASALAAAVMIDGRPRHESEVVLRPSQGAWQPSTGTSSD